MSRFKKIILWSVLAVVVFFLVDVGRYFFYPNVADLQKDRPGKTAFMEHREEVWQQKGIKKKISTSWVPLSNVSPYVMKAVIIAEDDKFWSHEGFDFEAMQKALEKDLKKKTFKAGGSTISQQLAKNLFLSPAKNPVRKVKEAILTWRIEQQLSKRRIMELYLNVAEWGDGMFGVGNAARRYYGKSAGSLGPREAAELAAALPNPRRFNPDINSRYAASRADRIYQIMVRRGIVIEEYDEVIDQKNGAVEENKDEINKPAENPPNDLPAGNTMFPDLPKADPPGSPPTQP
ncbi:MAG: monofunctional biosynthetic peptidoglycan transglycosylase [Deltaproteobacteria bacterium]